MDLEGRRYTLKAHEGVADAPVWSFAMPTAGDVMDARRVATTFDIETETLDQGEGKAKRTIERKKARTDLDSLGVGMVARALRGVDNLTRGGAQVVFPVAGTIEEKTEFVRRLPYAWLGELGAAAQSDADLDSEEEVGASAVRVSDDHGKVGDVRLREVQATDAA